MKASTLPLVCGMLGAAFSATVAARQPAAEDQARDGRQDPVELDGVVVTAQKRVERLLDVPMSITAVTGEQLSESGIGTTRDLQQVVPGLTAVNNGLGFVPVLRGISSQGTSPGDESNVSIYLDDAYLGAPMTRLFDLADIERIEVLKGPQGTLFGRNATGGAIRIVTRSPSFTTQGSVNVDYGFDYDERIVNGYVTGPISSSVAGSLSVTYREGDGYVEGIGPNEGRTFGGPDNHLIRGKLLFQVSDELQMTLTADTMEQSNDAVAVVFPRGGINPYPGTGAVASQPLRYAGNAEPRTKLSGDGVGIDVRWDRGNAFSMRSITAYRYFDLSYQSDNDRTDLPLVSLSLDQFQRNLSQEFNFSGTTGGGLDWLAGIYYYNSSAGTRGFNVFVGVDPATGSPTAVNRSHVDTVSYAGFGDLTWNVADRWHLTLGVRYTSEKKDYRFEAIAPNTLAPITASKSWNSPTWRAVARYDISRDVNLYVSMSNGFKSGVFDAYSAGVVPANPEKVTALEVGTKARISGITLSAAAYAYDYTDIQVASFATVGGAIVQSLSNAAEATMRGIEFSAEGALSERFWFATGLSWLPTARFDRFETALVTVPIPGATQPPFGQVVAPYDVSGSRVPRSPEWTANLRLTYAAPPMRGDFSATVSAFFSQVSTGSPQA